MSYNYLPLDAQPLLYHQLKDYLQHQQEVSITYAAHHRILRCRQYLDEKLSSSETPFYGINTGFGYLQNVQINDDNIARLQHNLLLSHACGMGEYVPQEIVRTMLMLKIKGLSYGYSGVHIDTVKRLTDLHNHRLLPVVYTQGSLGASGDLAPLSHMALPLIGEGFVWHQNEILPSATALLQKDWAPLTLHSKEGLALINGTQFMTAYGVHCTIMAERLLLWADAIAAMSLDAFDGVASAFHAAIHAIRPHSGQMEVAANMRRWLHDSEMLRSEKQQVQDPYSFRCIPQVHGASRDAWQQATKVFLTEVNSVTDNPNIFPDEDLILSAGNFHGQPLALQLDFLAIAMSEIANISERRTYQLISGQRNLPLFLVEDAGLNSGFMIPQYTAAGIVSENKQLCTPASVDSISSSNNQEDHVSMGANAAVKCLRVLQNVERVLSIELLTAAQALDFRKPLTSSAGIEQLHALVRSRIPFYEQDRLLHTDMMAALQLIQQNQPHSFQN